MCVYVCVYISLYIYICIYVCVCVCDSYACAHMVAILAYMSRASAFGVLEREVRSLDDDDLRSLAATVRAEQARRRASPNKGQASGFGKATHCLGCGAPRGAAREKIKKK